MKKNKFFQISILAAIVLGTIACKDQLNVGNPNQPTILANVANETGLVSFSQGAVYYNGFANGDGWLGDSYFSLVWGYHELLADNVGADASNNQISTIAVPDYFIKDDATKITNPSSSTIDIVHSYNSRAATGAGNNAVYYQWLNMYAMNNSCNLILQKVDEIKFEGDEDSRKSTFRVWAYWWKAYAYASIGSMYYSGLIVNNSLILTNLAEINNVYVSHDQVLAESNKYLAKADSALAAISSPGDFTEVLSQLIPSYTATGHGGVLTIDMWKRNINTMLARNLLLNRLAPFVNGSLTATVTGSLMAPMSPADWAQVKTYTTNGILKDDYIFTGRTTGKNDFFTTGGGSVAALTTGNSSSTTFKVSERVIQNFDPADLRLQNNFADTVNTYKNNYTYTTRWCVKADGYGVADTYLYTSQTEGNYELPIGPTFEENQLMLAEADIQTSSVDAGLGLIDDVRTYLGAGIAPVKGTTTDAATAMKELVKERRVALLFRGLEFYDSRRWGWTYDISKGGGSYGNTMAYVDGSVDTNVTINYNFMDYWDVPADESVLNPPSSTGLGTQNPNYIK